MKRKVEIAKGSPEAIAAARKAIRADVAQRALDLAAIIRTLIASGATSLRAITDGLNAKGIPTPRGNGQWNAVQVARVLKRLE